MQTPYSTAQTEDLAGSPAHRLGVVHYRTRRGGLETFTVGCGRSVLIAEFANAT